MEEQWVAERYRLHKMSEAHPDWDQVKLAQEMGRSYNWVKKWRKRLAGVTQTADLSPYQSQSRARKTSSVKVTPAVVKEILQIRDEPPEGLKRTPGPKAILYYLPRAEALKESELYLPTSTSTIWAILNEHQRIERPPKIEHVPLTRAAPLEVWQLDFKTVGTVKPEPGGKQANVVETLNHLDTGSSILLANPARADFNAETTLLAVTQTLRQQGLPREIQIDRDPRFVGPWSNDDFPSPLIRLLLNLDIAVEVHPPHRPDKNCYVERVNKTYQEEAIDHYLPENLWQTEDMNREFQYHFNNIRPNQALSCGNQPPRVAFANLPTLPSLPTEIDPDHWLTKIDGQLYRRRVNASGVISLNNQRYYIQRQLKGRTVLLQINAQQQAFQVILPDQAQPLKTIPLKDLYQTRLPFTDYLALLQQEAISQWRLYLRTHPRYVPGRY